MFRQNPLYWRDRTIAAVQPVEKEIFARRVTRWDRIGRLKASLAALRSGEASRGVTVGDDGTITHKMEE